MRGTFVKVSVTYDVVTEESVVDGATADNGWIDPKTEARRSLMNGRKRDTARHLRMAQAGKLNWRLRDAIAFISAQNCAHHESCWTPENNHCGLGVSATDAYETHSTDAQPGVLSINYDLHVQGLSAGSYARLARVLASNGVYFANMRAPRVKACRVCRGTHQHLYASGDSYVHAECNG